MSRSQLWLSVWMRNISQGNVCRAMFAVPCMHSRRRNANTVCIWCTLLPKSRLFSTISNHTSQSQDKSWLSAFTSAFPWQLHSLFFVTVVEHFPGCCLCPAHGSTDWFCAPQTRASSSMQAIFCSCWHTACVGQWHACRSRHLQPWTSLQTHLPLHIIYLQPLRATCFSISMGDFSNLLPPFSSHLSGMGWRNWQCQVRHGGSRTYLPFQQSDAQQEQCCCTVKGNVKMLPLCPSATPRPILLLGAWNKVGDANKSFILASDSPSEYICDWQALGSAKTLRIFN